MADDPIAEFLRARTEAIGAGEPWDAAACALGTVGESGRPSVRIVLCKEVDASGFRVYTNLESRKGTDLCARPHAALAFHWDKVRTQFRIEGSVTVLDAPEADRYFAARPRDSQLGAWASDQSRPIASRSELLDKLRAVEARYAGIPVPRPPHWGGFLLVPDRIERWLEGDARLHQRAAWERVSDGWRVSVLQP